MAPPPPPLPPPAPPPPLDAGLHGLPPLDVEPMPPARLFLSLQGRIDRATFWRAGVFTLLGAGLVLTLVLRIAGLTTERAEGIVNLLLAWPSIALSVKRWHDLDRTGWWALINLVPQWGWLIALVANGFPKGTPGVNRYGPPMDRVAGLY